MTSSIPRSSETGVVEELLLVDRPGHDSSPDVDGAWSSAACAHRAVPRPTRLGVPTDLGSSPCLPPRKVP